LVITLGLLLRSIVYLFVNSLTMLLRVTEVLQFLMSSLVSKHLVRNAGVPDEVRTAYF